MLNPLKLFRYLVFVVFVASNAIIASAAVWNLTIVENIAGDVTATAISTYLIVLGALGLIVIFTVIFVDICEKDVFIVRVWFELSWVIVFFIMNLGGAAAVTAQSNGLVCNSNSSVSLCASTQVLQAFTWICAILLLGYFFLLFVSAIMKHRDDVTVWSYTVRKVIWQQTHKIVIPPSLPPLPRFRTQVPVIAAPRPRRIITMPDAYRSGLGPDYEFEHYRPPAPGVTDLEPSTDRPLSPLSLSLSSSPIPVPVSPTRNLPQKPLPAAFAPFYPSYVQAAINPGLSRTSTAHSSQVPTLFQASSSPPPLGDWPRRDATSLPARGKRKQNLPLPPVPYSFTMPTAAQQRRDQPRSRPSGPRRRSNSGDPRLPSS